MALEAVVFSQDHPPTTNYGYDHYNLDSVFFKIFENDTFCRSLLENDPIYNVYDNTNYQLWDGIKNEHQYVQSNYSLPEGHCNKNNNVLSVETETPPAVLPRSGGRRKRRRRSCKNEEAVEQQRMTHITVERNRRKQMNDYLALIRSFMPPSYAPRGDQASIVGGAINYVKELEQLLQTLEAHKRSKQNDQEATEGDKMRINDYFTPGLWPNLSSNSVGVEEEQVQVTVVETHANVKILARKKPKQLLKLVVGFQGLRLNVLHLNVTSSNPYFFLYSFSLKVEDGCEVNTVEDITAAANQILAQIHEEAAAVLL